MGVYSEIISAIIKLVLTLCSAVITVVVVPWLKETAIPWLRERHMYELVSTFVQAAEKMASSGAIDKDAKKRWVLKMLAAKGIVVNDEIEAMIESAVVDLDLAVDSGVEVITGMFDDDDFYDDDEDDDEVKSDCE